MSIFNKENKVWQIEEMETVTVDKQGKETGNWNGYAVSKILDPVNYCFLCAATSRQREEYHVDVL